MAFAVGEFTTEEPLKCRHEWEDWAEPHKVGLKRCVHCGLKIEPLKAERSPDCYHNWKVRKGVARCPTCGYKAKGDFSEWWKKWGKYESKYRPHCLSCRIPLMDFGRICAFCAENQVIY